MKVFVCFFALFVAVCLGQAEQAETEAEPQCNVMCAMNYRPVCSTYPDGSTVTHGNACSAGAYNCREKITPTSTSDGACGTFTILPYPYPQPQILPAVV